MIEEIEIEKSLLKKNVSVNRDNESKKKFFSIRNKINTKKIDEYSISDPVSFDDHRDKNSEIDWSENMVVPTKEIWEKLENVTKYEHLTVKDSHQINEQIENDIDWSKGMVYATDDVWKELEMK
jgi:hypothetical protein